MPAGRKCRECASAEVGPVAWDLARMGNPPDVGNAPQRHRGQRRVGWYIEGYIEKEIHTDARLVSSYLTAIASFMEFRIDERDYQT